MNISLCLIAAILIGSSLFTMISAQNSPVFNDFKQTLTAQQQAIYEQIAKERLNIYMIGLALGFGISLGYMYYNSTKKSEVTAQDGCVYTGIMMITLYVYYNLAPKKTYMLNHITSKEQVDAWLEIYKFMQRQSFQGVTLGALGYFLFTTSFDNKKVITF